MDGSFGKIGQYDPNIKTAALQTTAARGFVAGDEFGKFYVGAGNRVVLFSAFTKIAVNVPLTAYATIKLQWYPGSRYRLLGAIKNLVTGVETPVNTRCLDGDDPEFTGENPGEIFFDASAVQLQSPPAAPPTFNAGGSSQETMRRLNAEYLQWELNPKPLDPILGGFEPVTELIAPMDYVRITVADVTNANLVFIPAQANRWWLCLQIGANAQ
jgi:hypothetical protein